MLLGLDTIDSPGQWSSDADAECRCRRWPEEGRREIVARADRTTDSRMLNATPRFRYKSSDDGQGIGIL
jgi:hypothetical protein